MASQKEKLMCVRVRLRERDRERETFCGPNQNDFQRLWQLCVEKPNVESRINYNTK